MNPLPALTAEIDAALRQSIADYGVIVPVVYNRGELLDGHNRERIAAELGASVPRLDLDIDQEHADRIAVELNTARRQMTDEVRLSIVAALEKFSNRAVAKALGVGETTVRRDREKIASGAPHGAPEKRLGLDGKSQSTRKKPTYEEGSYHAKRSGSALHDKLQTFLGQMTGSLRYFEEADMTTLASALTATEIEAIAKDVKKIAVSCRSIANNLQEVCNASE